MDAAGTASSHKLCGDCEAENPQHAKFCKECGGELADKCAKCGAQTPPQAQFCPECGEKRAESRDTPAESPADVIDAAARELPSAAKRPSSSIMGNVLLFLAFLSILLVAIYVMNKDAPKETSPFEGGPPPGMSGKAAAELPNKAPEVSAQDLSEGNKPFTGVIKLGATIKDAPAGTLFIIVRDQGFKGPPSAVQRVENPTFPLKFTIGRQNLMTQDDEFTGPFDVTARLDRDGQAGSSEPGDLLTTKPTGAKPGDTDVEIILDKRL